MLAPVLASALAPVLVPALVLAPEFVNAFALELARARAELCALTIAAATPAADKQRNSRRSADIDYLRSSWLPTPR
jgi:hypothetical protein